MAFLLSSETQQSLAAVVLRYRKSRGCKTRGRSNGDGKGEEGGMWRAGGGFEALYHT
jgi:hypothetical protein